MKAALVLSAAATLLCLTVSPARADGFIVPSIGVDFGGSAGNTLVGASQDGSKVNVGVAVGMMTQGIFGVEEDVAFAPNFFGSGGAIDKTRVATLMTNLIVGVPIGGQTGGGVRPYVSGGVGVIYRTIDTTLGTNNYSSTSFGYDLGGGVMGYFADHVGIRADVRYFRNVKETGSNPLGLDIGQFNFYRGSVGVLFRF